MSNDFGSGVWYGELRATRGNIVVIRDDQLPDANKGRVYLYNTERDAIVQYDESIVCPKLFPLDPDQQKQAEEKYNASWEAARKHLIRTHGKPSANAAENKKSISEDLLPTDDDGIDEDDDD